jgi:hypothetical protein
MPAFVTRTPAWCRSKIDTPSSSSNSRTRRLMADCRTPSALAARRKLRYSPTRSAWVTETSLRAGELEPVFGRDFLWDIATTPEIENRRNCDARGKSVVAITVGRVRQQEFLREMKVNVNSLHRYRNISVTCASLDRSGQAQRRRRQCCCGRAPTEWPSYGMTLLRDSWLLAHISLNFSRWCRCCSAWAHARPVRA